MSSTPRKAWSPYMVGAAIGLLGALTALTMNKMLGASTTFLRASEGVVKATLPEHHKALPHYHETDKDGKLKRAFKIDWQFMLLVGVAVGALLASIGTREFRLKFIPNMWHARFGRNPFLRWLVAFLGGVLVILGARMAGGCTSGHGISGMMQLSVSGFVAAGGFFVGGILTALLMYRMKTPKTKAAEGGEQ